MMDTTTAPALSVKDQRAADRASYDDWRELQEREWQATGATYWFDHRAIERARVRRVAPPADAFEGPYWRVRPYLVAEAVEWFEQLGRPRYTFADWQRLERDRRAAQVEADRDAMSHHSLDQLAYWRELNARRGAFILDARSQGATWAEIGEASGMSRQQLNTLAKQAQGPVPAFDPEEPF